MDVGGIISLKGKQKATQRSVQRIIQSKTSGLAPQGKACYYRSVCHHPIELSTLRFRHVLRVDAAGQPPAVYHLTGRDK